MQLTIVKFMAFGRPLKEVFERGENFKQIHEVLNNLCNTYVPIEIITVSDPKNMPLSSLNDYKTA